MLPVHYTETKWNHNENLPLTVSHHCIIPLPPIHRRLLSRIIKREHWCFPLPISCFLFLTWIFNWAISNHLFCYASSLLCHVQLESIVSETGIKYTWSCEDERKMYYLEERRYYSCFFASVHQDRGSAVEEKTAWYAHWNVNASQLKLVCRHISFHLFQWRIIDRALEVLLIDPELNHELLENSI